MSSEKINYHHQNYPVKKRKIFGMKMLLFVIFLLVMGVILITTFYKDISFGILGKITGRIIGTGDTSKYIDVSMELTVPELNLNGDYSRIAITGTSPSPLIVGSHQFSLQEMSSAEIVLEDFSGKISINEETINIQEGKVSKIIINGMPVSDKGGKVIKISAESPIFYNSVDFQEEIHFKKLDYVSSGRISWGGNVVRLNNERVEIINFIGIIKIQNKMMNLNGIVENVKGKDFRVK